MWSDLNRMREDKPQGWLTHLVFRLVVCGLIAGSPLGMPRTVLGQATTASLSGRILDETGAVVPDASVTIMNTATTLQRRVITNSEGYFLVSLLPAGNYTLTAEMPNFAAINVDNLLLQVSIDSYIEITLRPKRISESVLVHAGDSDVEAAGNKVDINNATVKYSIGNREVVSLPILTSDLGRNTLGVLPYTVVGVAPTVVSGSGQSDTNLRGNQMSINGSRPSSISFNLEGGDNNDYELNRAAAPLPNPDALQEFTVVTSNYQADLGRSSGGVINAAIKSGTNHLRGNARYFMRNESLDARGFFDPRKPRDRLHTPGGQIGGPITLPRVFNGKNRAFFFVDYEGTRSSNEILSSTEVLSLKRRAGDFSDLPVSDQPRDPLTGVPFPGGRIPRDRINPISRVYLDRFIPIPNDGDRNFRTLLPNSIRNNQVTAHLDYRVGEAENFTIAFLLNRLATGSGVSTPPVGSEIDAQARNANFVLRETHSFTGRTVNQFTSALTRFIDEQTGFSPGAAGVAPSQLGFTGVHPQTGSFLRPPGIKILTDSEVDILTGDEVFERAKTTWQIKDDLSHVRGPHSIKLGGEVRGFLENISGGNDNGSFQFGKVSALSRRNSISDFLIGYPSVYRQISGNIRYPRQRGYYIYGMDDWRIRRNLMINLGLRYELAPPVEDKLNQVIAFRPGQKSQRFPNAPVGLLFVGDNDPILGRVSRGLSPVDKTNLAPRVGIAYSPLPQSGWGRFLLGDGKTAIRSGWGVFYDQTPGIASSQFSFAEPFSVSQRLPLSEIAQAGGTFSNPFGSLPNPWPLDLRNPTFFTDSPSLHVIDPTLRQAYVYQYNLTIQRELPSSLLLEIAYVGTNGFRLNRQRDLNQTVFGPDAITGVLSSHRLYPGLSDVLSTESSGRSRYDSLQVGVRRRFSKGLTLDASYVFAKALDNGADPVTTVDSAGRLVWARSEFDRRHNFVASFSYDLPTLGLRWLPGCLIDGWQISGIAEIRSGMPMAVASPTAAVATDGVDIVGSYVKLDPRKYQTILVDGVQETGNFFFDPKAFRNAGKNEPGTLGRNVFDGPGMNLWSASVIKRFRVRESEHIVMRADVRNLFNHANFQTPFLSVTDARFGQVIAAAPGRNIQLSLRYNF